METTQSVCSDQDPHRDQTRHLREALLAVTQSSGPLTEEVKKYRNQLSTELLKQGKIDEAHALFTNTEICHHLLPVQDYLCLQGARIMYVSSPFEKSRNWVYFHEVVLDVENLIEKFKLSGIAEIFSETHYWFAPTQGIICREHNDGLLGGHPKFNPQHKRIH